MSEWCGSLSGMETEECARVAAEMVVVRDNLYVASQEAKRAYDAAAALEFLFGAQRVHYEGSNYAFAAVELEASCVPEFFALQQKQMN